MKKILLIAALIATTICAMTQTRLNDPKNPEKILNDRYTNGLFKTVDGTIFDIENQTVGSYLNILDWLEGRVAGLQVFVSRNGVRVPVIRGSVATIFVDEISVDASYLNALPVNDIAMIKVIKGPFAGAIGNGGGGTIAIYTIRGDDEEEDEDSK